MYIVTGGAGLIGSAVVKTVAGQLVTPRGYRNV